MRGEMTNETKTYRNHGGLSNHHNNRDCMGGKTTLSDSHPRPLKKLGGNCFGICMGYSHAL